ncbi:MAG TPA: DUF2752 domain-containing protein [Chthoniobacterales bacterium]
MSRHSLAPSEIDHELLWLLVSLGTLALVVFWFAARLPTPQCAFHSLTGLPCPTCGATRAAYQFLHGHFTASFFFNPLAFLTFCGIFIFDFYAVIVLLAGARRFRFKSFSVTQKLLFRGLAIALLLGNWLYLLAFRS